MTLEKKEELRRVEYTFTDGKLHPECHCEYLDIILEDGKEISRSKRRLVKESEDCKAMIAKAELYKQPALLA